jgi:hypothetical protein
MYSDKQNNELAVQGPNENLLKCHNFGIFLSIF